jgi:hypothetical protein
MVRPTVNWWAVARIDLRQTTGESNTRNASRLDSPQFGGEVFLVSLYGDQSSEKGAVRMDHDQMHAIAEKIEMASTIDPELASQVWEGIKSAFPDESRSMEPEACLIESTDSVLELIAAMIPGWEISLRGFAREPDGHWICTLRESTASDDDEVIGIGTAPALPLAMLLALLRIAALRLRGYS